MTPCGVKLILHIEASTGFVSSPFGETCGGKEMTPCGVKLILHIEASTGFEPVVRVLQTLALPLGHDAVKKNRAGDEIRTHDLLLGKETFYH